ncbi:MAG: hypothetical protein JST64_11200, partial [Actinobacteria bacterium]|nr:hypothetical protein [Actinomycetota bacterium]
MSRFRPSDPRSLPRRGFLRGGLAVGAATVGASVAAACGDSQAQGPSSPATTPAHALIAAFPQGSAHIPAGVPMRLPYLISDREGVPLSRI